MILQADARRPNGQFEKGSHWRERKPFWSRVWMVAEYLDKARSASDIAAQFGVTENAILFWLKKHGIKCRTVSEVRKLKHWGATGASNPMFGKRGSVNPNYRDGSSPERQRAYARSENKEFLRAVYLRDGYRCIRCGAPKNGRRSIHAHHIEPWAGNQEKRFDMSNVVTLCRSCHQWVHSRANMKREYLVGR